MCITRDVQSTQNNKLATSLQYLKEHVKNEVDFLSSDKHQRFLQIDIIILGVCGQSFPNHPNNKLAIFCNISRKKWVIKLKFRMQISMNISYKFLQWILMRMVKHFQNSQNSKSAMSLQYLKIEVRNRVHFLRADKQKSFLQVDFNTLDINIYYKVILSLLMDMIRHSQSTQSSKFTIFFTIPKERS